MTGTVTAQEIMADLHAKAGELEQLSVALHGVMTQLEPVEADVQRFIADFEIGLWTAHVDDGAKLPARDLRVQLAHRAMSPELYGRFHALAATRDRLVKRISALRTSVEASRSLLSALKEGLI